MSSTLMTVVFNRALVLWADPKHRCKGYFRRPSKYGMQMCGIGVLRQARRDCGIKAKDVPTHKLARALGFEDEDHLFSYNDSGRTMSINRDDECQINRYHQDNIYQRMQDFVKGTIDNDFHERNKAEGVY